MAASAFAVAAPNPAELAVTRATEFLVKGGIFKRGEGILVRVVLLESGRHELELVCERNASADKYRPGKWGFSVEAVVYLVHVQAGIGAGLKRS